MESIFTSTKELIRDGKYALPVISISFIFAGLTIVITHTCRG